MKMAYKKKHMPIRISMNQQYTIRYFIIIANLSIILSCFEGYAQTWQQLSDSVAYYKTIDVDKAIEYGLKALKLYKTDKSKGADDYLTYGVLLNEIGTSYFLKYLSLNDISYLNLSKKFFVQSLKFSKKQLDKNSSVVAQSYYLIGSYFYVQHEFDDAITNYKKSLSINMIVDIDSKSTLDCYKQLGNTYELNNNSDSSLFYFKKALKVAISDTLIFEIADIYHQMGIGYGLDADSAIYYLNKALDIYKKIIGEKSKKVAQVYETIGNKLGFQKQDTNCIEYYKRALQIYTSLYGSNNPKFSHLYNNIAKAYFEFGYYNNTLKYSNKSLRVNLEQFNENSYEVATAYEYKAQVFQKLLNYEKAIENYEKALLIYKHLDKNNIHNVYQINKYILNIYYINTFLGNLYRNISKFDKSLYFHKEAIKIARNLFGNYSIEVAVMYTDLVLLYINKEEYNNAITAGNNTIEIINKLSHKKNIDEAEYTSYSTYKLYRYPYEPNMVAAGCYLYLGLAYMMKEDFYEALAYYKKAIDDYEKGLNSYWDVYDTVNVNVSYALVALGVLYRLTNNYELSNYYLRQMLRNNPNSLNTIKLLAENYYFKKSYRKSFDILSLDIKNNLQRWHNNYYLLSEKDRVQYYRSLSGSFELLGSLLLYENNIIDSIKTNVYNYNLITKGILFESSNKIKSNILLSGDEALLELFHKWILGKQRLAKLYEMPVKLIRKNNISIESIEKEVNEFERKLAKKSKIFESEQIAHTTTWETVKGYMNNDVAAIEIIRYSKFGKLKIGEVSNIITPGFTDTIFYAALILTSETKDHPKLVLLKNGNALETKHYNHYKKYLTQKKFHQETDWESYKQYWAAIDSVIKDKKVIYLSPDGVYNKINLLTMITPDGKYLGDTKDIRIVSSTRDLIKSDQIYQPPKIKSALLVGAPQYDLEHEKQKLLASNIDNINTTDAYKFTQRSFDNTTITDLPATKKEVESIAQILKNNNYQTTTLTGEFAIEEAVKSVNNPTILHIATHGYFAEDIEYKKNNSQRFMGIETQKAVENPLLRSGLLLAGAERTIKGFYDYSEGIDNGILTAYEVQNMNLDSTELVVLSACETGLGEIKNGEGVYGLQRAFKVAGARCIIMSLWKVDDRATQQLMTSFYNKWLSGKTKREAFKEAQNELKQSTLYDHPYYWGGFILIGD